MGKNGDRVGLVGGQVVFKHLTTTLSEKQFEMLKIRCWLKMLNDGENPVKWLKPSAKGQKVNFKAIKDTEDYNTCLDELEKHIVEMNEKYSFGVSLERPKEKVRIENG